jgi:hypothetical protein
VLPNRKIQSPHPVSRSGRISREKRRHLSATLGLKWPLYNDDFRKIVAQRNITSGVTNVFSVFDPNIQNPYSMHYTLGIQREVTGHRREK